MPEPVLVSIATAVATKAALDLYGLVKRRFERERERDPQAGEALEAATRDPGDASRIDALAEQIDRLGRADPEFGRAVQAAWQAETSARAEDGGVVNQITGGVVGKSFQGRDVHGDVNF